MEDVVALLDALPDGVVIVGQLGNILLVNGSLQRMSGFSAVDVVGQPVECLVPQTHRDAHARQRTGFFLAPTTRPMNTGIDTKLARMDGAEIPVEIHISPIEWEGRTAVLAVIRPTAD